MTRPPEIYLERSTAAEPRWARLDPMHSMRPDDRFRVGSLTKTFVATIVLPLVGEGILSLDDKVDDWLPWLLADGDRITVGELLNHTSGLFDYLGDPRSLAPYLAGEAGLEWAPRELIALATAYPPVFFSASAFGYSNVDYLVLGLIAEKATGTSPGGQLGRRLSTPPRLSRDFGVLIRAGGCVAGSGPVRRLMTSRYGIADGDTDAILRRPEGQAHDYC